MLLLQITMGTILAELLIAIAIVAIVFIVFSLGRLLIGLLANSVLGLISIYLLNVIFGLGIPYSWPVIIATAIFGLPAVFVIVILKLGGVI